MDAACVVIVMMVAESQSQPQKGRDRGPVEELKMELKKTEGVHWIARLDTSYWYPSSSPCFQTPANDDVEHRFAASRVSGK